MDLPHVSVSSARNFCLLQVGQFPLALMSLSQTIGTYSNQIEAQTRKRDKWQMFSRTLPLCLERTLLDSATLLSRSGFASLNFMTPQPSHSHSAALALGNVDDMMDFEDSVSVTVGQSDHEQK